jgi:hypothetical protein
MKPTEKINIAVNLTLIVLIIIVLSRPESIGSWWAKVEKGYKEAIAKP